MGSPPVFNAFVVDKCFMQSPQIKVFPAVAATIVSSS